MFLKDKSFGHDGLLAFADCAVMPDPDSKQLAEIAVATAKTAQDIAADHKLNKISVISGIGTKEYYKNKCGFKHEGTYMTKNIELIQTFRNIDRIFFVVFTGLFLCLVIIIIQ